VAIFSIITGQADRELSSIYFTLSARLSRCGFDTSFAIVFAVLLSGVGQNKLWVAIKDSARDETGFPANVVC
jgi:hypothetical protein